MKRRKRIVIILLAAAAVIIPFVPYQVLTAEDGGTREYNALAYKAVAWNRITAGEGEGPEYYRNTSVYWFPENLKTIDELWKTEYSVNG